MSKLFTVAGTSVLAGVRKFRVANGRAAERARVLEKNGHTSVDLRDLPRAMTKDEAQVFISQAGAQPKVEAKVEAKVAKVGAKAQVREKDWAIPRRAPAKVEAKVAKTPDEIAAIRAKNLETMRAVLARRRKLDALERETRAQEAVVEADADTDLSDIPQFLLRGWGATGDGDDADDFNYVGSRHHY